jgi:lipoprotein-anchoring transpeptidase ErfK/SrfK
VVVVKDEHRTFLYDHDGDCIGIFPNAHGTVASGTDVGLKKVRTKLGEEDSKAAGRGRWNTDKAFGKRILDLSWASAKSSGEELHGTYDYANMGKDVSHGCVRHYNEHIIQIFDSVSVGDYVAIVNRVDDPSLGE